MGKEQKQLNKAKQQLVKADLLNKNNQFKKSAKLYDATANDFLKLYEFKLAEECFVKAAKSYIELDKNSFALISLRNAGNICIFIDEFLDAHKYFNNAVKLIPYLNSEKDRELNYLLFASLSYLCYLIVGKEEQGLALVKKVRKKVNFDFFKENSLIRLVKDLTVAMRKSDLKYLEKIEQEFGTFKFTEAENILVKKALVTIKSQISIKTALSLDKEQYITNELIKLTLDVDTKPLLAISKHPFYNYEIEEIKISKLDISLSNNLTSYKKPNLPIILKPGQNKQLEMELKVNFQIEESYIGPVMLTCELDENFTFYIKSQVITPNIISPPASLEVSIKNQRPPLIGKTFPLEILILNKSEGEALDVKVDVEFPEQIKVMRGTITKQIYSLKTNEDMKWDIQLKPLEAGDYMIKIIIKFQDPDQNKIEEIKEFPFSIKL